MGYHLSRVSQPTRQILLTRARTLPMSFPPKIVFISSKKHIILVSSRRLRSHLRKVSPILANVSDCFSSSLRSSEFTSWRSESVDIAQSLCSLGLVGTLMWRSKECDSFRVLSNRTLVRLWTAFCPYESLISHNQLPRLSENPLTSAQTRPPRL